jgi:hypothetical protein
MDPYQEVEVKVRVMISMERFSLSASRVMSGKRLAPGEGAAVWGGTHDE